MKKLLLVLIIVLIGGVSYAGTYKQSKPVKIEVSKEWELQQKVNQLEEENKSLAQIIDTLSVQAITEKEAEEKVREIVIEKIEEKEVLPWYWWLVTLMVLVAK